MGPASGASDEVTGIYVRYGRTQAMREGVAVYGRLIQPLMFDSLERRVVFVPV